jgi:hypothetical protein
MRAREAALDAGRCACAAEGAARLTVMWNGWLGRDDEAGCA